MNNEWDEEEEENSPKLVYDLLEQKQNSYLNNLIEIYVQNDKHMIKHSLSYTIRTFTYTHTHTVIVP